MSDTGPIKKWSELQNGKVSIPSVGKVAGIVEDFYFKPESTAVDALLVRTRLGDTLTLPVSKIEKFEGNTVIIASEQMLTRRPSPYPLASSLIGNKVQDEKGREVGTIGEIILNIEPVFATRVAGFALTADGRRPAKTFSADAVSRYEPQLFTLQDQFARKLR